MSRIEDDVMAVFMWQRQSSNNPAKILNTKDDAQQASLMEQNYLHFWSKWAFSVPQTVMPEFSPDLSEK